MMNKCYVRQGRKFVPVPDYTGYFYSRQHGFTKEKTPESFAIVISQDVNIATLAFLEHSYVERNWESSKEYCELFDGGYMPSLMEMLQATKFKEHLVYRTDDVEWTSTESSYHYAWALLWYSSEYVYDYHKSHNYYVRIFFKRNVLDI